MQTWLRSAGARAASPRLRVARRADGPRLRDGPMARTSSQAGEAVQLARCFGILAGVILDEGGFL